MRWIFFVWQISFWTYMWHFDKFLYGPVKFFKIRDNQKKIICFLNCFLADNVIFKPWIKTQLRYPYYYLKTSLGWWLCKSVNKFRAALLLEPPFYFSKNLLWIAITTMEASQLRRVRLQNSEYSIFNPYIRWIILKLYTHFGNIYKKHNKEINHLLRTN